jgi:hypothetical protein
MLSSYVVKQGEKARELQKKGIRPVKTTDLQIGKKYISVLDDGTGEFTLKSMILDDYQPPMTDPNVRIMGKTYRITAKEWWFSDLKYANEWFIEVNAKPYMNTKSRRRSNRSRRV